MPLARGERFHISLDADDDDPSDEPARSFSTLPFVGDVKERDPSHAPAPTAPSMKSSATGFPAHRKRRGPSTFSRQRAAQPAPSLPNGESLAPIRSRQSGDVGGIILEESDRQRIDEENRQKIADMAPEEIERERQELFAGLNPSLIERLLRRANLDDGSNATIQQRERKALPEERLPNRSQARQTENNAPIKVSEANPTASYHSYNVQEKDEGPAKQQHEVKTGEEARSSSTKKVRFDEPSNSSNDNDDAVPVSAQTTKPTNIHFPSAPQPPPLDPSSPNFLTDLHDKFFPTLEHDASKLEWLSPLPPAGSEADRTSPYHPSQTDLHPNAIRFGFDGALLPPRLARQIPTGAGLHHHGDAPEAAGYTVPELARLARSRVPSQRCVAYQTLGRLLYRLGTGEFGDEHVTAVSEEDEHVDGGARLARGLWKCVEEGKVIETLTEEANRNGGHMSAKAYAQEALWNWRRGGGRMRKAA